MVYVCVLCSRTTVWNGDMLVVCGTMSAYCVPGLRFGMMMIADLGVCVLCSRIGVWDDGDAGWPCDCICVTCSRAGIWNGDSGWPCDGVYIVFQGWDLEWWRWLAVSWCLYCLPGLGFGMVTLVGRVMVSVSILCSRAGVWDGDAGWPCHGVGVYIMFQGWGLGW